MSNGSNRFRIPVILVTGFLGSGKTSFLQHLAASQPEREFLFLVNEFAESSVDEATLESTGLPVQSVVGGSLFCECKAGEFVKVMQGRVLDLHKERQLDGIIIETSGIADPEAIGRLMNDHGLDEYYEVRRIVTIVAPKNFIKLLKGLPVMEAQVRASDLVIVNKTDLVDDATIKEVSDNVQLVNPDAAIQLARHCVIDFSLEGNLMELPAGELSTCDSNPFSVEELPIPSAMKLEDLERWLNGLPTEILRVKGNVLLAEGAWSVEKTVDSLNLRRIKGSGSSRLILIAHEDNEELLKATVAALN